MKRQFQDLIPVENRYHMPYQITGKVNMIEPVSPENNEYPLAVVTYAENKSIPVGLYG
jgi:hypothetical protein